MELNEIKDALKAHEHLFALLDEKMDKVLNELTTVTILNGDDGQTPTSMSRKDFNQMLYNRTSLRHKFNTASSLSSKLIPFAVVVLFIISIVFLAIGQKDLAKEIQNLQLK